MADSLDGHRRNMGGMNALAERIGVVLIGRNEGARLVRCLASVTHDARRIVYVDSGSTDGSVAAARAAGAEVVELDPGRPFTAARARNEGFARLLEAGPLDYVQLVDGDCELQPGWIATATAFLDARPDVVAVRGRLREQYPEATVYNYLCDLEWRQDAGEILACGGIAMMRADAFCEAGGFDVRLIAGEEPELCLRLRKVGWKIWNLAEEMALHDANMTRFSQWWRRTVRAGHAFAEGAAMHGTPPERHCVSETRRALAWGLVLPVVAVAGAVVMSPWLLGLVLLWPVQMLRLVLKGRSPVEAVFLVAGKVPEALGVLTYWTKRLAKKEARLIEYK